MKYLTEDFSALEVVGIGHDDALDGVDMIQMVNKVAFAQIDGQFGIG